MAAAGRQAVPAQPLWWEYGRGPEKLNVNSTWLFTPEERRPLAMQKPDPNAARSFPRRPQRKQPGLQRGSDHAAWRSHRFCSGGGGRASCGHPGLDGLQRLVPSEEKPTPVPC